MARPCKSKEEKRDSRITVRYTDDEYKKILKLSKSAGLDKTVFVREASLEGEVLQKDTITPEMLFQLGKMGNNINQIAKRVNSNAYENYLKDKDQELLQENISLLNEIANNLMLVR